MQNYTIYFVVFVRSHVTCVDYAILLSVLIVISLLIAYSSLFRPFSHHRDLSFVVTNMSSQFFTHCRTLRLHVTYNRC